MLMCPLHGVKVNGPSFTFPKFDPPPFEPPRWSDYDRPEPWPDLESRPDEGVFEGMSRHGLCQLVEEPVGNSMRINGHEVWRWEESSPITRILSDGRPRGSVELSEEWMQHTPNLGGSDSPLRAAVLRWAGAGRTWYREDVPGRWSTLVAWDTAPDGPRAGTVLTHYAGEPLG